MSKVQIKKIFVLMLSCCYLHRLNAYKAQSSIIKNKLRSTKFTGWLRNFSTINIDPETIPLVNGRYSSNGISLDANSISENPDILLSHLKSRKASPQLSSDVLAIIALHAKRKEIITEGNNARNVRKTISQQIGQMMKESKHAEVESLKVEVEKANEISSKADTELEKIEFEINKTFSVVPNLLDDRVPEGSDDKDNVQISEWGEKNRLIGDSYLWHDEIAIKLGGLDNDAANRISGTRFSILKGPVAKLERALTSYFLDFHTERGYEEVSVPYVVSRSTLEGTGQLPKFEEDLFKISNHKINNEDCFLIPTAEVPVTNIYREKLLEASDLPIKHVCHSPCYRAEAGSYGRDTRGLLRQHQFHKVELVKVTSPETSVQEHEQMRTDVEELMQSLDLPYRTMLLCSGDIGFSARICYDIEVWLPGQQQYREISSISNCYDFQAKRMSLRCRQSSGGATTGKKSNEKRATVIPHTINGSGVAVGRALVAILENNQNPDGSVSIPEKLRPYMGVEKILPIS